MGRSAKARVLFVPDYTIRNPYQRLLARSLTPHGAEVEYASSVYRLLGIAIASYFRRRVAVLHLHWLNNIVTGDSAGWASFRLVLASAALLLFKFRGTRVVWTVHNLWRHELGRNWRDAWLDRAVLALADTVIVHSAAGKTELEKNFSLPARGQRVVIIPHGHYVDVYPKGQEPARLRAALGIPAQSFVFLFFGTIRTYKGIDDLLRAFALRPEPDNRLLVVGSPAPLEKRKVAELLLADRVVSVRKFVPDADARGYFECAQVVVLPYRAILTSGSLLLAMSLGKAVIVPNLGDLASVLPPDYPLLYDPSQSTALGDCLARARSLDLVTLGERLRSHVARFDWETIGRVTASAYRLPSPGKLALHPLPT